jgi:hypothetical protein
LSVILAINKKHAPRKREKEGPPYSTAGKRGFPSSPLFLAKRKRFLKSIFTAIHV